jgi:predicted lipoprotein with Yx(FWY)xxD motif
MNKLLISLFAGAVLTSATTAFAAGMLADSKGMTLYTFDKDKGKVSACYSDCAKMWPPYMVQKGEKMGKGWAMSKRKDGKEQWTYDGHPLYYFADDKKAGDMMGDGKGGVWHVVKE